MLLNPPTSLSLSKVLYFVLLGSSSWYKCTVIHVVDITEMGDMTLSQLLCEHKLYFFHSSLYTFYSFFLPYCTGYNSHDYVEQQWKDRRLLLFFLIIWRKHPGFHLCNTSCRDLLASLLCCENSP